MTRLTNNRAVTHAFFYQEGRRYSFAGLNVSFTENFFYSYATVIAARAEGKDGRPVYLISRNGMSMTTSRHISYLRSACPADYIEVPFRWGDDFHRPDFCMLNRLSERFEDGLKYAAEKSMTRAENRRALIDLFDDAAAFSARVFDCDFLGSFRAAYEEAKRIEGATRSERAPLVRATREKAIQARAELISKLGYLGAVRLAYEERDVKARRLLNPAGELSFVWHDDDGAYRTSQGIRITMREGDAALKLWAAGKLRHGMLIGIYTVRAVTKHFVKVGCHKIPVENIKALMA